MSIDEVSNDARVPGVAGRNSVGGFGVFGLSDANSGVVGESKSGHGVVGQAHGNAFGVFGTSDVNSGVVGESKTGHGFNRTASETGYWTILLNSRRDILWLLNHTS